MEPIEAGDMHWLLPQLYIPLPGRLSIMISKFQVGMRYRPHPRPRPGVGRRWRPEACPWKCRSVGLRSCGTAGNNVHRGTAERHTHRGGIAFGQIWYEI